MIFDIIGKFGRIGVFTKQRSKIVDETKRQAYLNALEITQWEARLPHLKTADSFEVEFESPPAMQKPQAVEQVNDDRDAFMPAEPSVPAVVAPAAALNWDSLRYQVKQCHACDLAESRIQTVFGVGNQKADCLIIGEAPGADEDRQGEPFVGKAGQLLNEMLMAIGLKRESVFIANILKCRPPNNRDPRPNEVVACQSFLQQQIQLIQPKVILSVGRISAQNLLGSQEAVGRLRGKVHSYSAQQIPLVVTYHPAYLLRSPLEKRKAWDDLKLARQQLVK